jgi:formylglycine-generating enzyme required for sulfatase activity
MKSPWLTILVAAAVGFLRTTPASPDESDKSSTPVVDQMPGKEPGDVRDDNGLKMKFVWCPPGLFKMEYVEVVPEPSAKKEDAVEDKLSDDDDVVVEDVGADVDPTVVPARRRLTKLTPVKVVLTQGYWLGKYEVTQSEWKRVMQTEPWKDRESTKEGDDFPATWTNWDDCTAFCLKLTKQERQAGRLSNDWQYTLPTEAQWERACRALSQTRFCFGDDESKLGDYAWTGENTFDARYAHRVGLKKPNRWGLCDMHGNVWEWCRDVYSAELPGGRDPEVKSDEKTKSVGRVFKGGSWAGGAAMVGSGKRYGAVAGRVGNVGFGFRVALTAVRSPP